MIKMSKYIITEQEYQQALALAKQNTHKMIDARLKVIILRYEGLTYDEIAKKLDFNPKACIHKIALFKKVGLEEYARMKYKSNRRNLTEAQEAQVLKGMAEKAEKGELVTAADVRMALEEVLRRKTRSGYVYDVMKRHQWGKKNTAPTASK